MLRPTPDFLTLRSWTKALGAHMKRRKAVAKAKGTPFNLKEGGREASPRLVRDAELISPSWLGPWVDFGLSRGPASKAAGRLCSYSFNAWSLVVKVPCLGGWELGQSRWLNTTLRGLTGLVSLKLRFKGKSFRWHRRRGGLVLRFGHSHLVTCTPPKDTKWRKSGKTKILFFNSNVAVLKSFLRAVVRWREPNRYHSRGLRLSRQRIMRKAGKVSAYR